MKKRKIDFNFDRHPGQQIAFQSKARHKVLACGRRWGKTVFGWITIILAALEHPGLYWWVAPTYKQLSPITRLIRKRKWLPHDLDTYRREEKGMIRNVRIRGGSEIWFHSADRADTLRGEGLDGVVVDEAAFLKEERWTAELRPSLMDKKGWALFISTPNGKNWFYRLYLRGQDSSAWSNWESWRQSTFANSRKNGGFIDHNEIEKMKWELPDITYRQEILAEFIEGEGTIFRNIDDVRLGALGPWERDRQYSVGIDLAKVRDFTVLTAIDDMGHLRGFERYKGLDWSTQEELIKSFMECYPGVATIDSSGAGDPMYEKLSQEGLRIRPYKFTNQSKRELIENLMIGFDEGRWTIPDDPLVDPLINELKAFTYEITPMGNIRYGAPPGLHDDCVISFALAAYGCRYLRKKPEGPVSYVFEFPRFNWDPLDEIRRRPYRSYY